MIAATEAIVEAKKSHKLMTVVHHPYDAIDKCLILQNDRMVDDRIQRTHCRR